MLKIALEDKRKFNVFHLITGQDYPVFSEDYLSNLNQIVSNLVRNFIPEKSHKSIMLR